MKTLLKLLTIAIAIIIATSCENESSNTETGSTAEKMELLKSKADFSLKGEGPLIYLSQLYPGDDFIAQTPKITFWHPSDWNYYKFFGIAGQIANINIVRVDCEMDPAFTLYYGTSTTTEGLSYNNSTNPDLTYVVFRDDDIDRPAECEGTCFAFWDPAPDVLLPYTGWYTLAVYDAFSCKPGEIDPLSFHLTINGISNGTIDIDGCDTGVTNILKEHRSSQGSCP